MRSTLEVIHITDLHLLADPEARLHGWAVEPAFQRVLDAALENTPRPDAIVLGGDLVDDESVRGYERLNNTLARLPCPVLAMAGNHDAPQRMAHTLSHAVVHERLHLGEWQLIALDSHMAGHEAGELGQAQLERLDRWLAENTGPTVLFVHHPPTDVGAAWIDAIGLRDRDALEPLVARHAHVKALVCGHAHQAAELAFANRPCLVTPSTMRQFAPRSQAFAQDATRAPGYRRIELMSDHAITSTVERVTAPGTACG